ncbi:hypothetical protein [Chelativorans salis]|uniref:Uncharacterized protein n=1 Tax=Chelativorans salis TaxID=2978478 RepID=A0ABT2LMP7_9HYPH|nr:hypothetical protein [Chelativorans sp. EGI FJ00035]MCT7374449.1 hypothetical protein [Chelativorans sp. EGI FJ00035]
MSHYTVGMGATRDLQRYARQADKARSAALQRALGLLMRRIGGIWRGSRPTNTAPLKR